MSTIRHATPADKEEVVAIWSACDLVKPQNDPFEDFDLALQTKTSTVLVLEENKELRGAVVVGLDGHRSWFYYLAVMPAFQSLGYGHQLVDALESWAIGQGAPKTMLMVRTSNAKVIGFYEKLGYKIEETSVLGKRL